MPAPGGISFDEASAILASVGARRRLPAEQVSIGRADGRVLARPIVAPIDLPSFDNSAMDGFALRHADLATGMPLRIVGEQFAGLSRGLRVGAGECARITTGAPLPAGADTVLIREHAREEGGVVHRDMLPHAGLPHAGANVRHAGEDVRTGECVLRAGGMLTPARVGVAAALGIASVEVARRPTVAVFTTGDELVEPGLPLQPGQVHDANRPLLMGLLRAEGLEPVAWPALPDEPGRIAAMLSDAASGFDLVLTCGAVSAGEKDHIPALLQRLGRVHFWKVRMKPGMPLLFGELGPGLLLGLPGNPVSVLATWLTLGRALVDALQGRDEARPAMRARLSTAVGKTHARREFLRGQLHFGEDGGIVVTPDAATGSHRLSAAARANALVVLPEGPVALAAGDPVDVLPY